MAEVNRLLGPMEEKVNKISSNQERLYNTNGGPPGFLQTARKEDDGRFEMIFSILDEHKEEIKPISKFIEEHEAKEQERTNESEKLSKRLNVRLIILGLVLSAISLISANMQGCRSAAKSLLNEPTHSQNVPTNATNESRNP